VSEDDDMLLSVVVVNWNSCSDLESCLRSLEKQTYTDLETIVVDNGSTDGSSDMVRREFPNVVLLAQTENHGFGQACNAGILASHGEWVCMLNNDGTIESGWAEALVRAAEKAPARCGMLMSLMVYSSRPGVVNSTGIVLKPNGGGSDRLEQCSLKEAAEPEEIFCPSAGACAYRRAMLDEITLDVGFFDERHFMYYEDTDLGWRARLAGWSAMYVPSAVMRHDWHGSSHRHGDVWLQRMSATNHLRTVLKNGSWQMMIRATPRSVIAMTKVLWNDGLGAVVRFRDAARESLAARTEVERMRTEDRRALERRWTRG
jgi:GT2 family glycosyltransferase